MRTDEMFQDDGERIYICTSDACGYDGDEHCQNCGYAVGEEEVK